MELTQKQVNVENQAIFIADDMLIVGCDIGSETHYIRAIDVREGYWAMGHLNLAILQKALKTLGHGC